MHPHRVVLRRWYADPSDEHLELHRSSIVRRAERNEFPDHRSSQQPNAPSGHRLPTCCSPPDRVPIGCGCAGSLPRRRRPGIPQCNAPPGIRDRSPIGQRVSSGVVGTQGSLNGRSWPMGG